MIFFFFLIKISLINLVTCIISRNFHKNRRARFEKRKRLFNIRHSYLIYIICNIIYNPKSVYLITFNRIIVSLLLTLLHLKMNVTSETCPYLIMHSDRFKQVMLLSAYASAAFSWGEKLQIVIYAQTCGQTPLFFRIRSHGNLRDFARPAAGHSRDLVALSFILINRYFFWNARHARNSIITIISLTLHYIYDCLNSTIP